MWPFKTKRQERDSNYTDLIVRLQEASASGASQLLESIALNAAANLVGRCFAGAECSDSTRLTPKLRMRIGRELIRYGETLYHNRHTHLIPIVEYDIRGTSNPETWTYRATFSGPDSYGQTQDELPAKEILHLIYAPAPKRPYLGIGPMGLNPTTQSISEKIETALSTELNAKIGQVIPLSKRPTKTYNDIRDSITSANGSALLLETMIQQATEAPRRDYEQQRLGPMIQDPMINLWKESQAAVFKSCGVPIELLSAGGDTMKAMRLFVSTTLEPMGKLVEHEWNAKMTTKLKLDFDVLLRKSDIVSKAKAFAAFVKGGMTVEKAAQLSGILLIEE